MAIIYVITEKANLQNRENSKKFYAREKVIF